MGLGLEEAVAETQGQKVRADVGDHGEHGKRNEEPVSAPRHSSAGNRRSVIRLEKSRADSFARRFSSRERKRLKPASRNLADKCSE